MVGFHVCGPNEALVVTGCCYQAQPHVVIGSWTFVWPGIQNIQSLPLTTMSIPLSTEQGITKHGVAVSVKGTVNIKIDSSHKELLTLATQLFLGKTETEISDKIKDTLEALQRSTISHLTVEELISDREKLQNTAFEIMVEEMAKMGLTLVSYSVKDVKDCRLQVYCNLTSALKKSPLKNSLAFRKAADADRSIPEDDEKSEDKELKPSAVDAADNAVAVDETSEVKITVTVDEVDVSVTEDKLENLDSGGGDDGGGDIAVDPPTLTEPRAEASTTKDDEKVKTPPATVDAKETDADSREDDPNN